MKTKRMLMAAGVAMVALTVVTAYSTWAEIAKNRPAPGFKATTISGKAFDLRDLRGRVVLLDFWATWCPPCRAEAPELEKLWQAYRNQGLVVIGVAISSGSSSDLREFARAHKLNYWLVSDDKGALAEKYGVRPIPTTYIIGPDGKVRSAHVGFAPGMEKELDKEIRSVLPSRAEVGRLKPLE